MKRAPIGSTLVSLLAVSLVTPLMAQQSASFSLEQVTVSAAAAYSSSATFQTTVVVAQESPSGAAGSCNTGFINSIGFYSVLGDLTVPVRLSVDKSADPSEIELEWTGTPGGFELFRSTSPVDITNAVNLELETRLCDTTRSVEPDLSLLFFKVIQKPEAQLAPVGGEL